MVSALVICERAFQAGVPFMIAISLLGRVEDNQYVEINGAIGLVYSFLALLPAAHEPVIMKGIVRNRWNYSAALLLDSLFLLGGTIILGLVWALSIGSSLILWSAALIILCNSNVTVQFAKINNVRWICYLRIFCLLLSGLSTIFLGLQIRDGNDVERIFLFCSSIFLIERLFLFISFLASCHDFFPFDGSLFFGSHIFGAMKKYFVAVLAASVAVVFYRLPVTVVGPVGGAMSAEIIYMWNLVLVVGVPLSVYCSTRMPKLVASSDILGDLLRIQLILIALFFISFLLVAVVLGILSHVYDLFFSYSWFFSFALVPLFGLFGLVRYVYLIDLGLVVYNTILGLGGLLIFFFFYVINFAFHFGAIFLVVGFIFASFMAGFGFNFFHQDLRKYNDGIRRIFVERVIGRG